MDKKRLSQHKVKMGRRKIPHGNSNESHFLNILLKWVAVVVIVVVVTAWIGIAFEITDYVDDTFRFELRVNK